MSATTTDRLLKVGDKVRLRAGSPDLTIEKIIGNNDVMVVYWNTEHQTLVKWVVAEGALAVVYSY